MRQVLHVAHLFSVSLSPGGVYFTNFRLIFQKSAARIFLLSATLTDEILFNFSPTLRPDVSFSTDEAIKAGYSKF